MCQDAWALEPMSNPMNISGTQRQLGFATPEGSVHLPMQQHKKCVGRQEHQDLLRVSIAQLLPSAPVGPALVLTHQRYTSFNVGGFPFSVLAIGNKVGEVGDS